MPRPIQADETFGLVHPAVDAHTLGISAVAQLLADCGYRVVIADAEICSAANTPTAFNHLALLERWLDRHRITRLGFSYRLDPQEGAFAFGQMVYLLRSRGHLVEQGGMLRGLYFAGLPEACQRVKREHGDQVQVFTGDEIPSETLEKLGVPASRIPFTLHEETVYDETRLAVAEEVLRRELHRQIEPVDRSGVAGFGTPQERLVDRVAHSEARRLPPLMRVHIGPYLPRREEAVQRFFQWTEQLARERFLDILSVGTSQLSQSHFGQDWGDRRNGGGVPINSPEEFRAVWETARPMLVRTYAGTRNIPQLARMYEETIHIAWHALSFWWFSQIDGRGPYTVRENLQQHIETLRFIAGSDKPFEPNIPHHFAFRGADDVTYVVSAVLAARTAKALGVRSLILQNMLNTPKTTWGVQDLAKSRALLKWVRPLEDAHFKVILQPRAGLDLFSPDLEKAKAQLAAVSALMDDIEPDDPTSPPIVHVVSYSEASHLADPPVVNESVQITRAAIEEYRRLRRRGEVEDMAHHPEVLRRTKEVVAGVEAVLRAIEDAVPAPYTAEGLYTIFAAGFLPVPYLWEGREEFEQATRWRTQVSKGGVVVVDDGGRIVPPQQRALEAAEVARALSAP